MATIVVSNMEIDVMTYNRAESNILTYSYVGGVRCPGRWDISRVTGCNYGSGRVPPVRTCVIGMVNA